MTFCVAAHVSHTCLQIYIALFPEQHSLICFFLDHKAEQISCTLLGILMPISKPLLYCPLLRPASVKLRHA